MSRIILHIDLNKFFVRCEELKNPSLEGKPVIIGHSGRSGIVSTCSYEARKLGVSSGMPTFKALQLCPNAICLDGNYDLYSEKSNEFFEFLKRYTNQIEIASIDECFLDFTSILENVTDQFTYLLNLQKTLKKQTGLNCSIGVAPTKFLAKMASDLKKPNGITFLPVDKIEEKLYPLPIDAFFGIGKKTAPKLKEIGVQTIGDLANKVFSNDQIIRRFLGDSMFFSVKERLEGKSNDILDLSEFDPQSIGHSTTLMNDCTSYIEILSNLQNLSSMVASRAKKYRKAGRTISLVVKDTGFKLHNKSTGLDEPTNDENKIFEVASKLYKENFEGMNIRLVGVTLSRFIVEKKHEEDHQLNFWNYEKVEKESKTNTLIHELNGKLSKPSIVKLSDLKKRK